MSARSTPSNNTWSATLGIVGPIASPRPIATAGRTLFLLLAEFGTGHIPVERCAPHFGLSPAEAKAAAARQNLPVAAFRLGSQKSPWLVSAEALASYIDAKRAAADAEWRKLHAA